MPTTSPAGFSFKKGSIAKIEVWNFVTYDHSAIYPNDSLNLIVGPNGSGKSSIVCAMCLGFGGSPKLLQRGEHAKDYVQHDKDEATIEISLATGNDNEVVVLRRVITITRDQYGTPDKEKNAWFVDGKTCPVKEIQAIVASYNIQLANYTQFLPQDVVKEFPALTAEQLLMRTEQALGDSSVFEKHQKLIVDHETGKGDNTQFETQRRSLEDMKAQQEVNRREVEKFNEWKEICERVEMMDRRLPWLRYEVAMNKFQEYKQLKKEAKSEFNTKQKAWEPKDKEYKKEASKQEKLVHEAQDLKSEKKRKMKAQEIMKNRYIELGDECEDREAELEDLVEKERLRQRKIAKVKEDMDEIKDTIEDLQSGLQAGASNKEEQKALYGQLAQVRKNLQANKQAQDKLRFSINGMRDDQNRANESLRHASDDDKRKLERCIRNNREVAAAYDWVQENKDRFQKEVYGPLGYHVTVPDSKYALRVEAMIPPKTRQMFLTQCDHDREVLNDAFRGHKYGPPIYRKVFLANFVASHANYTAEVPLSQLEHLGVENYMIDVIDAPDVVKKTLCDQFKLQSVGVGSHKAEQRSDEVMQLINTLVTPNKVFRGSNSVHTGRRNLRVQYMKSGNPELYGSAVDQEEMDNMQQEVDRLDTEIIQAMKSLKALKGEDASLKEQEKSLQAQLEVLGKKGKELKTWQQKLKTKEKNLEKLLDEPSLEQETRRITKLLDGARARQHKQLTKMVDSYTAMLQISGRHDVVALQAASMTAKLKEMFEEVRTLSEEVQIANDNLVQVSEKMAEEKDRLRGLKSAAEKQGRPSEEEVQLWEGLPQDIDSLREEIRMEKSRADAMGGNDSVLKEFERKEKQIEMLEEQFAASQRKRDNWLQDLRAIHDTWLPKLRELIEQVSGQFSLGMSEMGFAGEVALKEPPIDPDSGIASNYREFAIDIKVKFKDGQPIRSLEASVQSGGEKSVSTMLYLISLQSLTEFPFRVVDEINQGMDARNERKMFEQIVRAASRKECPQYFVITPKLLTGLEFGDCVKVHFVWNMPALCGMSQNAWEDSSHCMVNVLKRKNANAGMGGTAHRRARTSGGM